MTDGIKERAVEDFVRRELGAAAGELDASALETLARKFVASGRAAVRLEVRGAPSSAARSLRTFDRLCSAARKALADRTTVERDTTLVAPRWRGAWKALQENRDRLDEREDVVGYGLGRRVRAGHEEPERCVRVLVTRKRTPSELDDGDIEPLPTSLENSDGEEIPVDVIEIGVLRDQAMIGDSVGPEGDRRRKGTIGAFGRDLATEAPVALTAMHVISHGGDYLSPCLFDDPLGPHLGRFLDGSTDGMDAAKIGVEPPGTAHPMMMGGFRQRGWRPVTTPEDRGLPVRMYGATSGFRRGYIVEPCHSFPGYGLDRVILVDIDSDLGDSGSGLYDENDLLLGILKGYVPYGGFDLRIFSQIGPVLRRLGCDVPST